MTYTVLSVTLNCTIPYHTLFHRVCMVLSLKMSAPCGLFGCKNWPSPFPGRMSYKATKPGLVSVLYLSMRYTVLFIRAPFYVSLVLIAMCAVFLVVVVELSVLAKWLARKTPLKKPNRGEGLQKAQVEECVWFSWFMVLLLLHCFTMYLCCLLPVRDIFPSFMARYSPFVLKAPLNPKQANKPWKCREILLCPGLKW